MYRSSEEKKKIYNRRGEEACVAQGAPWRCSIVVGGGFYLGDGEFKKRILSLTPVDIALYHGTWQAWDARYVKQMQKLVDEAKWAFPLKELYGAEDICSPEGEALFEISQWFKKWFGEDERVH